MATILSLTVTDAGGRQWEMRPYRGGLPRRVTWWRRWRLDSEFPTLFEAPHKLRADDDDDDDDD